MRYDLSALNPLRRLAVFWHGLSPSGLFVASFALLIALATAGLMVLPGLYTGARLGFLDALFTATSAVCVTNLSVVDPATYFTGWGQLWLLLFVQAGGLGLYTLTTLIIGGLGRRLSLRSEMIVLPVSVEAESRKNVLALVIAVAKLTFTIEAVGALILFVQWMPTFGVARAAWHAVFHAVSAFCNAGLSTFSDSLRGFAERPLVLLPVSALAIVGGFGFLGGFELVRWWRSGAGVRRRRLSTHTYAAATTTLVLLALGWLLFGIFEWNGVLAPLGWLDKVVNAWFLSVAPRSVGFHTVAYDQVSNASAYLTVLLMVIGGAPGGTAGGVKVTAVAVLAALAAARVRGRRHAVLHQRAVPEGTVQRTVSLVLIAFVLLTAGLFVLSFTEAHGVPAREARGVFLSHLFEVASALGTVGLSMGLTPELSPAGRLVTLLLMFVGRVGPLSFFAAISLKSRARRRDIRPAQEDLIVG